MTTSPASLPRPLRADAARNRSAILGAARAAVADHGGDVSLEDVARTAGVGIGTLYRHFPTRQALFEAAFVHEAEELTDRARHLALHDDARRALVDWLRAQVELGSHGHSMGAEVMAAKHVEGSEIQLACVAMREAGAVLMRRAQEAGAVRAGVDLIDVLKLMHAIVIIDERSPDAERAARMFDLVVAGITP